MSIAKKLAVAVVAGVALVGGVASPEAQAQVYYYGQSVYYSAPVVVPVVPVYPRTYEQRVTRDCFGNVYYQWQYR